MSMSIRHAIFATTIAAASIFACSENGSQGGEVQQAQTTDGDGGDGGASTQDSGSSAATLAQPQLTVCSEAQAIAIFSALNKGEIDVANAVLNRLSNQQAKAFAQRMIQDHTALDNALTALVSSAGISPQENSISRQIQEASRTEVQQLTQMTGTDLDRTYINEELLDHLKTLSIGDHLLTPSFKSAQLVAASSTARQVIVAHIQLATQVQQSVEGGACGTSGDGGAGGDGGTSGDGGGTGTDAGGGTTGDGGGTGTDAGGTGTDAGGGTTGDGGGTGTDAGDGGGTGTDAGGGGTGTDAGGGGTGTDAGGGGSTTL